MWEEMWAKKVMKHKIEKIWNCNLCEIFCGILNGILPQYFMKKRVSHVNCNFVTQLRQECACVRFEIWMASYPRFNESIREKFNLHFVHFHMQILKRESMHVYTNAQWQHNAVDSVE